MFGLPLHLFVQGQRLERLCGLGDKPCLQLSGYISESFRVLNSDYSGSAHYLPVVCIHLYKQFYF